MNIYIIRMFLLTSDGANEYEHTAIDGHKFSDKGRTWGWYQQYEDAVNAVMKNHSDMWECDFNYALIEEVPEGALPCSEVSQWFQASRYPALIIEKCEPPPYSNGICNFTIG